jgi:hypothetical protein
MDGCPLALTEYLLESITEFSSESKELRALHVERIGERPDDPNLRR